MRLLLSLFFLLSFLAAKENDYSVIVDKPFNDALMDITQNYDRTISAVGFTTNFNTTKYTDPDGYSNPFDYIDSLNKGKNSGTQIELLKLDDSANIILDKVIKLEGLNEAFSIIKTPDNGYFIGGNSFNGSIIVMKIDSNSHVVFKKIFGTKNQDLINKLISLRDGGVLAIGSSVTSRDTNDNIFQTGLGLNDIYITRISKNGETLWSRKYGTPYDDFGVDGAEAADGSILILSYTKKDNSNKNVSVMRIDQNGDKIWMKEIPGEGNTNPYKITRLRNNTFLLSLTTLDDLQKEQVRLVKLDLHQNILQDKVIQTTYESALKDIKEYADGKIIGVGYVKDAYNTDALVMQFDSSLNMLYQEHYGKDNFDTLNSVTILNNFQAAAAGIFTNENSQESNMWVIKINRDATLAQKSTKAFDILSALRKLFAAEIQNNQLQINDDLSIELLAKPLYFQVSQYILTAEQKKFLRTFNAKLIPFLLQYKDSINTLEINGHTSSEWGQNGFSSAYLKNEKLSMERSYSTMKYLFNSQNDETKKWLIRVLKGSGYSYSKKMMTNMGEDYEKSRRVSFKIILNSL